MKIPLTEWAARNFDPPPHRNTLMKWRAEGYISPLPIYIGRSYYVDENARFVGGKKDAPKRPDLKAKRLRSGEKLSLVERIMEDRAARPPGSSATPRKAKA
ncbi:MAG TPA: excisionase [Rhodocyclaceae bacterium]|nr:excisionase [Rhodocyclaceae bacterium]